MLSTPFSLQGTADRLLIYLTLYTTDCIIKLAKSPNKNQALKDMYTLAISRFSLPGEANFPLNAVYSKPQGNEIGKFPDSNIASDFHFALQITQF